MFNMEKAFDQVQRIWRRHLAIPFEERSSGELLRRAPWVALLGVLLLCGCERASERQVHAAKSKTPQAPALNVPAELTSMPPGYVALLRVSNPHRCMNEWLDLVGSKLTAEAVQHVERLCLGPDGAGRSFLSQVTGPVALAVYDDFTSGEVPRVLLRVQGGTNDQLNPWMHWLIGSAEETQVPYAGTMRQRVQRGTRWIYGEAPGGWIVGNDEPLVKKALEQKGAVEPVAPFDVCWKNLGSNSVFMALNVKRLRMSRSAMWEKYLGPDTHAVAWGSDFTDTGVAEEVYLHTAGSDCGILQYLGDGIDHGRLGEIPASAELFFVGSLAAHWSDCFQDHAPQPWRDGWSQIFGNDRHAADDAVGVLGSQFTTYRIAPNEKLSGELVAELAVDDPDALRLALKTLSESRGLLWKPLSNGNSLLAASDPIQRTWVAGVGESLRIAASKDSLLAAAELSRGHSTVEALQVSHPDALAWVSQGYLERLESACASSLSLKMLTASERTRLLVSNLWKSVQWRPLVEFGGDLTFALTGSGDGYRVEVDSTTGVANTLLILALAAWGQELQRESFEQRLVQLCEEIDLAQSVYRSRNQRFAEDLWQLHKSEILLQSKANGVDEGFVYRIRSDSKRWLLEVRRDADGAVFQVIPKVGVRRVPAGMRR